MQQLQDPREGPRDLLSTATARQQVSQPSIHPSNQPTVISSLCPRTTLGLCDTVVPDPKILRLNIYF